MSHDHDPWNEHGHRHPRAHELMDEALWDCVNEHAPFGSDEGAEAYEEYRSWRAAHPGTDLRGCIDRIGDEGSYPDQFTFDATIIATVLGQLVNEGRIDASVKPSARRAIARQTEAAEDDERRELLAKALRAIDAG
jgi:uncharacterized protein YfeS